jgi:hypothetical protein
MAFSLYSIDEAVDHKYVVVKNIKGQVKKGSLVHIMDARESSDGITVNYRVTKTKQDFSVTFDTIKQFCSWARPDKFIARHYENLTKKEIRQYLKVMDRTFVNFCLPILVVLLAIIWVLAIGVIHGALGIVLGVVLSIVAFFGVALFLSKQKENLKIKLYSKLNMGVTFK